MKRNLVYIILAFSLGCVFNVSATELNFVNIKDSVSYIRLDDPDETALTLDIKIDYSLPTQGIENVNLIKMTDMLISLTGLHFDVEGYPVPSLRTHYPEGRWVPATPANSVGVMQRIHSDDNEVQFLLWSEEAVIRPIYQDKQRLSMLASNHYYTGGPAFSYFDFCVNYSLEEQKFIYLDDLFPGIDNPDLKPLYLHELSTLLTEKATQILSAIPSGVHKLLLDHVPPTRNFTFTADGIAMRYMPMDITSRDAGIVEIPLTYSEINSIVKSVINK